MDKTGIKRIINCILLFFSFIFSLLGFSIIWCLDTWERLSTDELIFELTQPLQGTGSDMLVNFAVRCFVPAALLTVLITLVYFTDFIRIIKVVREKLIIGFLGLSFIFALICVIIFWNRLDITDYIKNSGEESTF